MRGKIKRLECATGTVKIPLRSFVKDDGVVLVLEEGHTGILVS